MSPVTASAAIVLEPPIVRAPPAIRIWQAPAAVACVIGLALVVAAAHEAAAPASSPIDALGRWGIALGAGLAIAFVGYAVGLVLLRRRAASVLVVLVVAAAVQLLPLAARRSSPPTRGRTGCTVALARWRAAIRTAILRARIRGTRLRGDGSSWRDTTSLYGPLFTLGSELHAHTLRATIPSGRPGCSGWSPGRPSSSSG